MFTPKRPDATCLIFERRSSPKRTGSSPPSPVFERPPMRFIAIASVSCASRESEPSDIAPVEKRLTISDAGSTSSSGMPPSARRGSAAGRVASSGAPTSAFTVGRVLLVRLRAAAAHGVLQQRDRLGVPLVVLAVAPPRVEPDDRQQLAAPRRDTRARAVRARPRRARRRPMPPIRDGVPREVPVDQLVREPDRLEDLRAAVRGDGRDPHLRDRLQEALADRLHGPLLRLLRVELEPPLGDELARSSRASGTG